MTNTLYGLNTYARNPSTEMGFSNFQWVLEGKVARSSQPGYTGGDRVQSISMVQIMFLKAKGISGIISANERGITDQSTRLLNNANIAYYHYPVQDFQSPTVFQLQNAADRMQEIMNRGGAVLVYCGFGQGRTGTFVAGWAMQKWLAPADGKRKMTRDEMCNATFLHDNFGVETGAQVNAIRTAAALGGVNATPAANPVAAGSGSSWTPPQFSGPSGLGMPDTASGPVFFANFNS